MNKLWKKYGCGSCDNYELLVVIAHTSYYNEDDRFKRVFLDSLGAKCIVVPRLQGGYNFEEALDNGTYGGSFVIGRKIKDFDFILSNHNYFFNGRILSSNKSTDIRT